jgi:hypothetical protein
MAKLENVKILDMVNGEPTRVEYNGAIYVKTEDDAEAGDLVRVIAKDGIGYVTQGGFYEIYLDEVDELTFVDDDGDERPYEYYDTEFETFRKVSETKASADLAERLAELERRLEALEERMKPMTSAKEVSQARRLTVGDYAKVVANDTGHLAKVGDIIKIVEDERDDHPYRCENLNGEDVWWFKEHELVPATDEEVAQAKAEVRWAKIGRKPGEFKKGDIVRVIDKGTSTLQVGEIGELGEAGVDGSFRVNGRLTSVNWIGGDEGGEFELICPVEQRFDLAAEGARQ